MGIAFQKTSPEEMVHLQQMIASLPAPVRATSSGEEKPPGSSSLTLPLIVNAGAAIKALAEFFEGHGILSKEEFVRILRKSQGGTNFKTTGDSLTGVNLAQMRRSQPPARLSYEPPGSARCFCRPFELRSLW